MVAVRRVPRPRGEGRSHSAILGMKSRFERQRGPHARPRGLVHQIHAQRMGHVQLTSQRSTAAQIQASESTQGSVLDELRPKALVATRKPPAKKSKHQPTAKLRSEDEGAGRGKREKERKGGEEEGVKAPTLLQGGIGMEEAERVFGLERIQREGATVSPFATLVLLTIRFLQRLPFPFSEYV